MNNLISIIVPIYNAEEYLPDCIESILSQTYKNLEVILINDGSSDDSLKICNYYKSKDNRIIVIDKPNEGVSSARNLGIEIAKGKYIGFVDSDDYIEESMYEELINQMIDDGTEVCVLASYTIKSFNKTLYNNRVLSGQEALKQLLLLRFPTSLWACLYSKNVIKHHKLHSEIHFFEDFEFNFRILSSLNRVSICKHKLYNYRSNDSSTNRQSINSKRMTCLEIYDLLIKESKQHTHKKLIKYGIFFRTHCIISVIASISKSETVKEEYYKLAVVNSKKMLFRTMISRYVPLDYKIVVLMFCLSPHLLANTVYKLKYSKYYK